MTMSTDILAIVDQLRVIGVLNEYRNTWVMPNILFATINARIHGHGNVNQFLAGMALQLSNDEYSANDRQFIIRHVGRVLAGTDYQDYDLAAAVRLFSVTAVAA